MRKLHKKAVSKKTRTGKGKSNSGSKKICIIVVLMIIKVSLFSVFLLFMYLSSFYDVKFFVMIVPILLYFCYLFIENYRILFL